MSKPGEYGIESTLSWSGDRCSTITKAMPESAGMVSKKRCKAAMQQELGLAGKPDAPLFGVVSRLTEQKGLYLVLAVLDESAAHGARPTVVRPVASGRPSARFMHWTAAPPVPLARLSTAPTATSLPASSGRVKGGMASPGFGADSPA